MLHAHMQIRILLCFFLFIIHHSSLTFAGKIPTPNSPANNLDYDYTYPFNDLPRSNPMPLIPKQRESAFGIRNKIATCVIIVITLLDIIVYKLRQLQEANLYDSSNILSSLPSDKLCRRFSLTDIRLATRDFDDGLVIGEGGFGKVYKGVIDNGATRVAVKRLSPKSKQGAPEFWTEIEMLSKFRHSHIVSLIGYCKNYDEMILVYEYMARGTLADHMYKVGKTSSDSTVATLSWVQRLEICIGAARGLDYLHTGTGVKNRVIHRDVKSSNILLDENWAAKISDFGLSKTGPSNQSFTHVSTNVKGTFGYVDPEYFLTHKLTKKSDVYAFGVVLFEVLCGRRAVDIRLEEEQWGLAGWAQHCIKEGTLHKIIDPNLRWQILPDSLTAFAQIADQCLQYRSKKRPTMSQVVVSLENALALQRRTDSSTLETGLELFSPGGAFDNQENVDYSIKQHEDINVVHNDAKPSTNTKGNIKDDGNITLVNRDVDVINQVSLSLQIVIPNLKIFTLAELETATRHSGLSMQSGKEDFGKVLKGWVDEKTYGPLKNGGLMAIAIKKIDPKAFEGFTEWQLKLQILGKFSHPNLVKILGYCLENEEFHLVYEYIKNGRLEHHLSKEVAKPLPWATRLKIAIGAAQGLAFLHKTENLVLYHQLKTCHIMLDEDYNAKLSNFELAFLGSVRGKSCLDYYVPSLKRVVIRTNGYANSALAPEYVATGHLNMKSDVYAFGVVLLELLTGVHALHGINVVASKNWSIG